MEKKQLSKQQEDISEKISFIPFNLRCAEFMLSLNVYVSLKFCLSGLEEGYPGLQIVTVK